MSVRERSVFVVFATFMLFCLSVEIGIACSIAGDPPQFQIQNDFDRATIIFVGEFQGIRRIEIMAPPRPGTWTNMYSYDIEATFKVTKNYKGISAVGQVIKVRSNIGGPCEFFGIPEWETEKKAASWLVYARLVVPSGSNGEMRLYASGISPTSKMLNADKKALAFLEKDLADRKKRMPFVE